MFFHSGRKTGLSGNIFCAMLNYRETKRLNFSTGTTENRSLLSLCFMLRGVWVLLGLSLIRISTEVGTSDIPTKRKSIDSLKEKAFTLSAKQPESSNILAEFVSNQRKDLLDK